MSDVGMAFVVLGPINQMEDVIDLTLGDGAEQPRAGRTPPRGSRVRRFTASVVNREYPA